MGIVSKVIEVRDQVKRAVDTFLACDWCGDAERDCKCGKDESESPAVRS